jgi:hypothetical protein
MVSQRQARSHARTHARTHTHTHTTPPALEMREDGEMADASLTPRAALGSSGFGPALGPQDIAVLVQTPGGCGTLVTQTGC